MKIMNTIKSFLSRFTNKPIEKGIGVSTDDNITLPRDTGFDAAQGQIHHRGTFFTTKNSIGAFELVGFVRKGDTNLYQLKHIYSGETLNITKNMLDFLFEKYTP